MKKISFLFTFMLALTSAHAQYQQPPLPQEPTPPGLPPQFPQASAYSISDLTYQVIDAPNSTFGYDVCAADRLVIHQTSIPALPGNEGFKTKADAAKVAELVIEKIRKGEMPPTVSVEELKQLGVIK